MSTPGDDHPTAISDEQLPDDVVPGNDNPLAEPLPAGESAGDLLEDGKRAHESADDDADENAQAPGSDA